MVLSIRVDFFIRKWVLVLIILRYWAWTFPILGWWREPEESSATMGASSEYIRLDAEAAESRDRSRPDLWRSPSIGQSQLGLDLPSLRTQVQQAYIFATLVPSTTCLGHLYSAWSFEEDRRWHRKVLTCILYTFFLYFDVVWLLVIVSQFRAWRKAFSKFLLVSQCWRWIKPNSIDFVLKQHAGVLYHKICPAVFLMSFSTCQFRVNQKW